MSHHVYLDTLDHGGEWLQHALCKADPDAMHPGNNEAGIAYAKRICGACSAILPCLMDALRTGDNEHGIRGGLRPNERRAVAKRLTAEQIKDPEAVASAVRALAQPTAVRSARSVWDAHTRDLADGHLGWRGNLKTTVVLDGLPYTPKQLSFMLHRGRQPVGKVTRTCEVAECVHPLHLTDGQERQEKAAAAEAGAV